MKPAAAAADADASPKHQISADVLSFLKASKIQLMPQTLEEISLDPDRKHGSLLLHECYKVNVSYLSVALRDDLWLQPYDHHKVREWDIVRITSGRTQVELKVPGVGWMNRPTCVLHGASVLHASDSESLFAFGVVHIVASALVSLINARFARHEDRLTAEKVALENADAQEQIKRAMECNEKYRMAQAERKKKRKTSVSKKTTK